MGAISWEQTDFDDGKAIRRARVPADSDLGAWCTGVWDDFWMHAVPAHSAIRWDYIRVEAWPDSGRVLLFPSLSESPLRIDRVTVQLTFEALSSRWEELERSDVSDRAFEREIKKVVRAIWDALEAAYEAKATDDWPGARCYFYEDLDRRFGPQDG